MDIQSAAHYLKHGYKIKRAIWNDNFLQLNTMEESELFALDLQDLLANDWELIKE